FKLNGDDELVSQQKPAFVDFLKSVSFESASVQQGLPPSHPPTGGSETAAAEPSPAQGSGEGRPGWQVPAAWKEIAGGPFLVAKFSIGSGDKQQTSVNVSMSQGQGGGLLLNVNRWRGQLGLAPFSEADVTKQMTSVDTAGGKAMFVDMTGTDAKTGSKA